MYIPSLRDDIFNRIINVGNRISYSEIVGGERIRNKREANNINFNDNITNEGFHRLLMK